MPRSQPKITPTRTSARLVDIRYVTEAGTVRAHGVPRFPQYLSCQLEDPDLDYRIVLWVQTTPRGSDVVGLQLAAMPGVMSFGSVEFPSALKVARQLDERHYLQLLIAAVRAHELGLRWEELVDEEGRPLAKHLGRLQRVMDEASAVKPRRYLPRHGATLEQAALIYRQAFEDGEHPTRAVQNKLGPMGYSTASALVREARAGGLLPPAIKGKPGWAEGDT